MAKPWSREGDVPGWLSRSGWSLALIALWRMRRGATAPVFWVPDFFCNSSLAALRVTGARLVFYEITEELAPDMAQCRSLADHTAPDVVLVPHYFGRPTLLNAMRDLCRRYDAWLVEDAAHVLRRTDGIGLDGDFVIYSPHKHLALPDGAVLVARGDGPGRLGQAGLEALGRPEEWAADVTRWMSERGSAPQKTFRHQWIWLIKRFLQKLGFRYERHATAPFEESLASGNCAEPSSWPPPALSPFARRLLHGGTPTTAVVARHRQRNAMVWDSRHEGDPRVKPVPSASAREWTPYLAAYDVAPQSAPILYGEWAVAHIPVLTWPDLPAEVVANRDRHEVAWRLRHCRLYLPVHQSLRAVDLLPPGFTRAREPASLGLEWDGATPMVWSDLLAKAGRTNLLQSWAYGAAKSKGTSWQVRRAIWRRDGEPIAIAQFLERRIGGLITVMRLNRGPETLNSVSDADILAIWREIASWGCWWRGRILSVAPDRLLSGAALTELARLGFYQRTPVAWESIWVDIRPELDALRRQLDRKWRNMLVASEKAGLTLEVGGQHLFDWMMVRYSELVADKGFAGVPAEFFRAWRSQLERPEDLLVLRALHDGQPVAGICLARHGISATYLIGWNGLAGRTLKANQYLLWQALCYLKSDQVQFLDLGGMNEEETPGITAFKVGLNGQRYELVGEYWKW